ncbi:MAG TPA: hypothetical protein VGS28_02010 [Candidatus Saccharimonadales bacterium]|nr:hypothetical protein [Candidatus Saccharimonadales bacterium]
MRLEPAGRARHSPERSVEESSLWKLDGTARKVTGSSVNEMTFYVNKGQ